jgi:hypothetical protein
VGGRYVSVIIGVLTFVCKRIFHCMNDIQSNYDLVSTREVYWSGHL